MGGKGVNETILYFILFALHALSMFSVHLLNTWILLVILLQFVFYYFWNKDLCHELHVCIYTHTLSEEISVQLISLDLEG